jgi:hypothetical protein
MGAPGDVTVPSSSDRTVSGGLRRVRQPAPPAPVFEVGQRPIHGQPPDGSAGRRAYGDIRSAGRVPTTDEETTDASDDHPSAGPHQDQRAAQVRRAAASRSRRRLQPAAVDRRRLARRSRPQDPSSPRSWGPGHPRRRRSLTPPPRQSPSRRSSGRIGAQGGAPDPAARRFARPGWRPEAERVPPVMSRGRRPRRRAAGRPAPRPSPPRRGSPRRACRGCA